MTMFNHKMRVLASMCNMWEACAPPIFNFSIFEIPVANWSRKIHSQRLRTLQPGQQVGANEPNKVCLDRYTTISNMCTYS